MLSLFLIMIATVLTSAAELPESGFPPAIPRDLPSPATVTPEIALRIETEFAKIRGSTQEAGRKSGAMRAAFPEIPASLPQLPPLSPAELEAARAAMASVEMVKPGNLGSLAEIPAEKPAPALEPPVAAPAGAAAPEAPARWGMLDHPPFSLETESGGARSSLVMDTIALQSEVSAAGESDVFARVHSRYRSLGLSRHLERN